MHLTVYGKGEKGMSEANKKQIGGNHYKAREGMIQPWDFHRANHTHEEFAAYLECQIIDYVSRYRRKGGITDLEKAEHILQKLIEIEKEEAAKKQQKELELITGFEVPIALYNDLTGRN